jgi:hypothetical protein
MRIYTFIFLILLIVSGCSDRFNNQHSVVIKGSISTASKLNGSRVKSSNELSLADARKVFLYYGFNDIAFADIVNGAFSANAQIGKVAALIFLDENNQYIGTFQNRGLNLLPLGNLADTVQTVIDLSTLTLVGTNVIPSHDPFGNEIRITDDEINSLKELSGFFEALAKNIDTDNDGVLDVLGSKQLFIISHFGITAGHWGLNDISPALPDSSQIKVGYALDVFGGSGFDQVISNMTLSGPEGNPYPVIKNEFVNSRQMNAGFFARFIILDGERVVNQPFRQGIYSLDIEGKKYTFGFSNIEAGKNLVMVVPTLHTNSEGKLSSFTLDYKLPGGKTINPENILSDVMLQFGGNNGKVIYESPWLSKYISGGNHVLGIYSHTLETPVDISGLTSIVIGYNDMLGNRYDAWWR